MRHQFSDAPLSIDEISTLTSSARTTIRKYLKHYEIPIRRPGENLRQKLSLAYGRRLASRYEVDHKRELETIEKMKDLRHQGYSYWKIASILNTMQIPTKTRKGAWRARSVQQILDRVRVETRSKVDSASASPTIVPS